MRHIARVVLSLLALPCLLSSCGGGAKAEPQGLKELESIVKKEDLPIETEIAGVFQAQDKSRIAMEPKEYSGELIIKYIIAEGSSVKEGDNLLQFESENLRKAIETATDDASDSQVALQKAQSELEIEKINQATSMNRVQKEEEIARRNLKAENDKVAFTMQQKETSLRQAENGLKDQIINFEQLKKLYEERDLHVSTEKILVERERVRVEEAKESLERQKREFEHFKKYELNAETEKKQMEVTRIEAELKKEKTRFEAALAEKEAAVQKAQRHLKNVSDKRGRLEEDYKNLKINASRSGIVFYGALNDSDGMDGIVLNWGGDNRNELRVGGRVRTHSTLMNIASMERLSVSMKVGENDIQHMKEGLPITLRPDAFPDLKVTGQIKKVEQIANQTDFFGGTRSFKVVGSYEGTFAQLRAGMNCRVTVHANKIPEAIQVPVVAVFEEGNQFFCVVAEGGRPVKRKVKIGATNGKSVQVTEGLRPGEKVYLYNPLEP